MLLTGNTSCDDDDGDKVMIYVVSFVEISITNDSPVIIVLT